MVPMHHLPAEGRPEVAVVVDFLMEVMTMMMIGGAILAKVQVPLVESHPRSPMVEVMIHHPPHPMSPLAQSGQSPEGGD